MSKRNLAGELRETHVDENVTLKGWVQKRRDLGGLIFIDLRDRSGIVQVVFNPEESKEAIEIADTVRNEYVVSIKGTVVKRDPKTFNPEIPTGEIEVMASEIEIINKSKTPPFQIDGHTDVSEDVRLKHRYIDLRRKELQDTIKLRHQITQSVRNFLNEEAFLEMETPILTKSTPEGARDYLVPSRVNEGEFYALPQSPQLFKQLLMVSGFEQYYQIARCFRDEDLRADRQPEFTQIDIETSFLSSDDIIDLTERMLQKVMKETKNQDVTIPFPRMEYQEAMNRFGSDKPDTRFGLELNDAADIFAQSSFKVFKSAIDSGGELRFLNVKQGSQHFSRKDIDQLTEYVKVYGAKGLAWVKVEEDSLAGPIAKFITEDEQKALLQRAKAENGDLLLFGADKAGIVFDSLGALRLKIGKELGLIDETKFNFLWVTDWPLLEYDEEAKRYTAAHHPFTLPMERDLELLTTSPEKVHANAYDIVLNGYELGGGSLRIYDRAIQDQMFEALGFTKEQAEEQFGFLLEALEYGTPPHGGIALGLDRIVMLLAGRNNLRDTILFPKTSSARDLMTDAPGTVSDAQLEELSIQLDVDIED
ncbi:MAG TPA: aspartate--tRNA ligase [Candidatus Avamphibacillus intestinigallinarum]|nr:aspartate--tRNA ligase [Candidatus Avamphibacillus intestinigallinarum]